LSAQVSFLVELTPMEASAELEVRRITRSLLQFEWLFTTLIKSHPDLLLPPCPSYPNTTSITSVQLPRLRFETERRLNKLLQRRDLEHDRDVLYFLTEPMTTLLPATGAHASGDGGIAHRAVAAVSAAVNVAGVSVSAGSQLPIIGHMLRPDIHHGFREVLVPEQLEGADEHVLFERRKQYLSEWEDRLSSVASCWRDQLVKEELGGKLINQVGYAFKNLGLKMEDTQSSLKMITGRLYEWSTEVKQERHSKSLELSNEPQVIIDEYVDMLRHSCKVCFTMMLISNKSRR
jgi:hypothetical protein